MPQIQDGGIAKSAPGRTPVSGRLISVKLELRIPALLTLPPLLSVAQKSLLPTSQDGSVHRAPTGEHFAPNFTQAPGVLPLSTTPPLSPVSTLFLQCSLHKICRISYTSLLFPSQPHSILAVSPVHGWEKGHKTPFYTAATLPPILRK